MSDESQPPQLRLRPRKRVEPAAVPNPEAPKQSAEAPRSPAMPPADSGVSPTTPTTPTAPAGLPPAPASPVAPAAPPTPPASEEPPSRFRLKPKLSIEPEEKSPGATVEPATPPPVVEFPPPPVPDEPSGIPRLRLKKVEPTGEDPVLVPPPPSPAPSAPPPPVGADTAEGSPRSAPGESSQPGADPASRMVGGVPQVTINPSASTNPSVVSPALSEPVPRSAPPPAPPPIAKPAPPPFGHKKKQAPLVAAVIALPVVLGLGAYFIFGGEESPAPGSAASSTSPSATVVPAPPVAPLPPIEPLPEFPAAYSSTPADSTEADLPAAKSGPVAPSPAFRAWLNDARITGVLTGASSRALINGRLVRPGDVVDATAGITFVGVDAERNQVIFSDRAGSVAEKGY